MAYPDATIPPLILRYKAEQLVGIEPGRLLTNAAVAAITQRVSAALDRRQSRCVVTFSLRLFRLTAGGDIAAAFQLLPPPPDAPVVLEVVADHPFVLEYAVRHSDDIAISSIRETSLHNELERLLGLLLNFRVHSIGPNVNKYWVLDRKDDDSTDSWPPMWAQEWYFLSDFDVYADAFSHTSDLAEITARSDDKYYSSKGSARARCSKSPPHSLRALTWCAT